MRLPCPFMYPKTVPNEEELADKVQLVLSTSGGHVGFITGIFPWKAKYWGDIQVIKWLKSH